NTRTPDLRILSVLPADSALVTDAPREYATNVLQAPEIGEWSTSGGNPLWQTAADSDRTYRVAELNSGMVTPLNRSGTYLLSNSQARIGFSQMVSSDPLAAAMSATGA